MNGIEQHRGVRLCISGGRNYRIKAIGLDYLDELNRKYQFTELLNGMASGVDLSARVWAQANGIPVKPYPALWDKLDADGAIIKTSKGGRKYNANAGPSRNLDMVIDLQMDSPPGIVVCFPGGKGTNNLYERAVEFGLDIYDLRDRHWMVYPCT